MKPVSIWIVPFIVSMMFLNVSLGWGQPKSGQANAPVITHSFAFEKGTRGDVVRLYISAHDPDGDMLRIATVAYQNGYGRHRPDWVFLKPPYRDRFTGYLQWNAFSSWGSVTEWTNVTLKVSVFDKAGNESNVVIFPHEFVSEVIRGGPLPGPFDQSSLPRLGYVFIDLAPNPSLTH